MHIDVRSNPFFKHLDPPQLEEFVSHCEVVETAAGVEVMSQGDAGKHVYFLIAGELSVRLSDQRRERELARLEPPAVVGEMAMLTNQPRSASVVAITAVKLLAIPVERFQERMAAGDPATLKVVANIAQVLALRLGALSEKILELESVAPAERSDELQQFRSLLFSNWSC